MWQLRCIATWGRPTPSRPFSALTETLVPSLKSVNLSLAVLMRFTGNTLFMLWPWPFTPWPWTFLVYRRWRDETTYQIWATSNNPCRSYCDLNIWPYDTEHVLRVQLCYEIILTKFKPQSTYLFVKCNNFWCWYVM